MIGDVGVEAGRGMTGGALTIEGDAGAFAGSGMRGGLLTIGGDAGERLGGPLRGETEGMNGGVIHVARRRGRPRGRPAAARLHSDRGTRGDYAGSRMIAGTLAIGGAPARCPAI